MKLSIVYSLNDNKLDKNAYSQVYRNMLEALISRFEVVNHINYDCSSKDIDADVIIFYDVHSLHHIKIDGIEKHNAIKLEYFDDPHQKEIKGKLKNGNMIHKLGGKQRCMRVIERNVNYIICPYEEGYFRYFNEYLGDNAEKMLIHFPPSPNIKYFENRYNENRKNTVLANGNINGQIDDCYDMRRWAFSRKCVDYVEHNIYDENTPKGELYGEFLCKYAGGLALMDLYPVPKYFEIPLAGCTTFAQYHKEYEDLGFKDNENCVYVNKKNFENKINDFVNNIEEYQEIANNGRKLVEENYTSEHFANYIYSFIDNL